MKKDALLNRETNKQIIYQSIIPWQGYVIDNFFEKEKLEYLKAKIDFKKGNNEFKKLSDHPFKINYNVILDEAIYDWFLSDKMDDLICKITDQRFRINPKSAIQFRTMNSASPCFAPHSDFMGEESLVMNIYLSEGWSQDKGGEFIQMKDLSINPDNENVIPPILNRAVLFESKQENYHRVQRVNDWERDSIIIEWLKD